MKAWKAKVIGEKPLRKEPGGDTTGITLPKGVIGWFDEVVKGFHHVYALGDPPELVNYNAWAPSVILEAPQYVDYPETPLPGNGDENPELVIISMSGIWHPGQEDEESFSWLNPTASG